ncbi:RNA polymerase sigma-70 factor [Flavihumibacter solisilvae]|uniref:RNA polymerase sigma-70 factor n=1 Tax=Flavihumibacter solisilvae TaxID=1349421 RepID=UPI0006902CBA|nr:RNA polymerase sigma-70 factor [Flavihumibacter solisilvae]
MNSCNDSKKPLPENIAVQIASGSEASFRQLYHAFYSRLVQFSAAITRNTESAEEIVEDVFVKIWQQKEKFGEVRSLRVYLYTAVKNGSLNYVSTAARRNITAPFDEIDIQIAEETVLPDQIMITAEMFARLHTAVESLPPRCKMIFKLIREDGLKYKEVGEILNISVNTIDAQMAIAVKRLMLALQTEWKITPPAKKVERQKG